MGSNTLNVMAMALGAGLGMWRKWASNGTSPVRLNHGHLSPHELFLYHAEFAHIEDLERIEKHLFLCDDCRDAMETIRNDHPESGVLDLYAVGRLNGPVGNGVESHLGRCEWCAETMPRRTEKVGKIREGLDSLLRPGAPAAGSKDEPEPEESSFSFVQEAEDADEPPAESPSSEEEAGKPSSRRLLTAYEFYTLGAKLAPLAGLTPHHSNEHTYPILLAASVELDAFLSNQRLEFGEAAPAGNDLAAELCEALGAVGAGRREENTAERVIRRVVKALDRLQKQLGRELGALDVYRYHARGTHNLRTLMEHPEASFDEKTWSLLPGGVQQNWTEAARCLVCGFSTAAVFHAVRALEALTSAHLDKLDAPGAGRSVAGSLAMLRAKGVDPGTVSLIEQAAQSPASFVSDSDALEQFDLTQSAIKALVRDMQRQTRQRSHWA